MIDTWKTVPLRSLISPTSVRNRTDLPLLSVVREKGVIVRKLDKSDDNNNIIPEDLSNYKVVLQGQFVINKMKAWQGSCGVSMFDGIVSPAYFVFNLNIDNPRFFNYAIRSRHFVDEFNRISKGIRVAQWDLDLDKLKYVPFPLPPRDEQDQIVRYLDWKVSRINKLINVKRKQIELLGELKRSIIDKAVSQKGDDWQSIPCKRLISLLTDYTANGSFADLAKNVNYLDNGYARLIRLTDLRLNMSNKGVYVSEEAYEYLNKSKLFGGEFLIANVGAHSGYVCKMPSVNYKATLAPNMMMAHFLDTLVNIDFVIYAFNSSYVQHQLKIKANNTCAQPKLNKDDFKTVALLVPSLAEQKEIVAYLDKKCSCITEIITRYNDEITLLTEYRTRLISDVVTGKLDVRGVAVPEYEAVEDVSVDMENTENEDSEE